MTSVGYCKKRQLYSIRHLITLFAPLSPASFCSLCNFIFPLSLHNSLCFSRASIVQKRIIYFQDEGSLTIRLCEKGNDSCLSSSPLPCWLLKFSSPSTHHHVSCLVSGFFFFFYFGSRTDPSLSYCV